MAEVSPSSPLSTLSLVPSFGRLLSDLRNQFTLDLALWALM